MKIAILFSGHIRTYDNVRQNIIDNLLHPLEQNGHTYTIYSSVWSNCGFRENGWEGEYEKSLLKDDSLEFEKEDNKRDYFINTYSNNKWENYRHLSGPETCGDAVSMYYKLNKCFNLIEIEDIDIIFRIRPDMYFEHKFDLNLLKFIQPNTIYMPLWHGKYEEVTCKIMDHFAFGDYNSMKTYCTLYTKIDDIIQRNDFPFTAEGFLKSHVDFNNLHIIRIYLKYSVMRLNGLEKVSD